MRRSARSGLSVYTFMCVYGNEIFLELYMVGQFKLEMQNICYCSAHTHARTHTVQAII